MTFYSEAKCPEHFYVVAFCSKVNSSFNPYFCKLESIFMQSRILVDHLPPNKNFTKLNSGMFLLDLGWHLFRVLKLGWILHNLNDYLCPMILELTFILLHLLNIPGRIGLAVPEVHTQLLLSRTKVDFIHPPNIMDNVV